GLTGLPSAVFAAGPNGEFAYQTRTGDTLIGIGQALLRRPSDWPILQRLNGVVDPYRMPTGALVRIPVRLLQSDVAPIQVIAASGEARVGKERLDAGMKIAEQQELATDDGGFVTLQLADGSKLTLHPQTRVRTDVLQQYRGSKGLRSRFTLEGGRIDIQAAPQDRAGAQQELRMPATVLSVRGTHYRAAAAKTDGRSLAEVTEGTVAVGGSRASTVRLRQGYGVTAVRGGVPELPTRLLPAPGLNKVLPPQQRLTLSFPLPSVVGASGYRAQIAEDQAFSRVVAERVVAGPTVKFEAPPDGDYWLRVRAIDRRGLEGFDAQAPFRIEARPEPPFPSTPANRGIVRATVLPFAWSSASSAVSYSFELAADPAFQHKLESASGITASAHASGARLEPGNYYWRVASVDNSGKQGPFGDVQTFELRPAPPTPAPPDIAGDQVGFSWASEPGQRFEFEMARDKAFSDLVESRRLEEPRVQLPRPPSGAYYMRVRATDSDGFVGPYTATQRFEVPPKPQWWLLLLPLVPALL
ncbi:MAG: FecR domain-containing protein, partial [Rhodocyclaceae bacterium]